MEDGVRRRQEGAGANSLRTASNQSQRRAQFGGRTGRNPHCAQTADAGNASKVAGFNQHRRVGILGRRGPWPTREALAGRRSSRTLGGIGAPTGREQVSPRQRLRGNPQPLTALADHGMNAMKKGLVAKAKLHNFTGVKPHSQWRFVHPMSLNPYLILTASARRPSNFTRNAWEARSPS